MQVQYWCSHWADVLWRNRSVERRSSQFTTWSMILTLTCGHELSISEWLKEPDHTDKQPDWVSSAGWLHWGTTRTKVRCWIIWDKLKTSEWKISLKVLQRPELLTVLCPDCKVQASSRWDTERILWFGLIIQGVGRCLPWVATELSSWYGCLTASFYCFFWKELRCLLFQAAGAKDHYETSIDNAHSKHNIDKIVLDNLTATTLLIALCM